MNKPRLVIVSLFLSVLLLWMLGRDAGVERPTESEASRAEQKSALRGSGAHAPPDQFEEAVVELSALEGLTPRAGLVPDVVFVEEHLTEETRALVNWLDQGKPVQLVIDGIGSIDYGFRPHRVTTKDFQIASSPSTAMPSSVRVYQGREFLNDGDLGEGASLAVVNDAISMAVEVDGQRYLVETDPVTNELVAVELGGETEYTCGSGCGHVHRNSFSCATHIGPDGLEMAGVSSPEGVSVDRPRISASLVLNGEAEAEAAFVNASNISDAWVDHSYFRRGPIYDASLKDIVVLMISGSTQTGSSSNLSSRAASYLTYAARVADTYERQLGLRVWLQELVLIANDSGEDDIEYDDSVTPNNPDSGSDDLGAVRDWCNTHRPQSTYRWGHAAGWTLVEGSGGGTIGWAWTNSYGGSFGFSVNERNWDWDVLNHELGHNVGSSHTNGGVMNGSLSSNNEDFFREVEGNAGYTGAMDIYNTMSQSSRNYIYGPADLRHPEEIPFGQSDGVSTPVNTEVSFNPLTNDSTSVLFGATNTLRLVEVGQVYPIHAGTTSISGNVITFTPAAGYTGRAWMTYTLGGDVGNSGAGWLHSADIVITIGGNNSDPSLSPTLVAQDDVLKSDFSGDIRINPLLNDQGRGRLWAGNVDVLSDIDGSAQPYSDQAFRLVSASVVTGNGVLNIETVDMTRNATASTDNTGYLVYTPGANEVNQVNISYTVEDADGNQTTGSIVITKSSTVSLSSDATVLAETTGDIVTLTFTRDNEADSTNPETVQFSVGGTASLGALSSDFAIGGFESFSPDSLSGEVVIPAGQNSTSIQLSALNDGQLEGVETVIVNITSTETLVVDAMSTVTIELSDVSFAGTELYAENFDLFGIGSTSLIGGWTNDIGDDFDWRGDSGMTPSSGTGPNGDHTSGSGRYLYTEASSNSNSRADLISPSYDLSAETSAVLFFAYHMLGDAMGELHIDVRTDGGAWVNDVIAPFVGAQSADADDWKTISVDLTSYLSSNTQIRFRGITGSSFTSDICIDDVKIIRPLSPTDNAPSISVQPKGITIEESEQFYLSVIASGVPAPSYQWKKNGVDIPGANSPSFYVSPAISGDTGGYSCVVSNGVGDSVTSSTAVVIVNGRPSVSIDSPISGTAIPAGVGVLLEATTSDDGPYSLTWTQDAGPGTISFGDTGAEDTYATFSSNGVYTITLMADDGEFQTSETIELDVGGPGGSSFTSIDVGNVAATGSSSESGGVWTLQGSGNDIWSRADEFRFNYVEMSGNGEIIARVTSQTDTNNWAKAGVMIRDSLNSNSANAAALITPANGVVGQRRASDGSSSNSTRQSGQTTPIWVKVERLGNTMTSSYSNDGISWTQLRSDSNYSLTDPVYIGLAVTSHNDGTLSTAVFDNVSGTGIGGNQAPSVSAGADTAGDTGVDIALTGSASDADAGPGSLTTTWGIVSGPVGGVATFADTSNPTSSVSFDLDGAYVLRLLASDTGATTFDDVTVTIAAASQTVAETWRQTYFGQTTNTGDAADGADFDGGGSSNLLERAFMTDPTDSNDDFYPSQSMTDVSGSDYLSMTYRRLAGGSGTTGIDYTIDDLTYCVQHVQDLTAVWNTGGITVVSIQDDTPQIGVQTVTVRLNTSVDAVDQSFIQLKVSSSE